MENGNEQMPLITVHTSYRIELLTIGSYRWNVLIFIHFVYHLPLKTPATTEEYTIAPHRLPLKIMKYEPFPVPYRIMNRNTFNLWLRG